MRGQDMSQASVFYLVKGIGVISIMVLGRVRLPS